VTSPNGVTPPGSATEGAGLAAWAAKSGDEWKTASTNDVKSSFEGPGGFWGKLLINLFSGFANLGSFLDGITDAFTGTLSGGGLFGGIFDHAQQLNTDVGDVKNGIEQLLGGGTRQTIVGSAATWTNPGAGFFVTVETVGGGQAGYRGDSATGQGGAGGMSGGYAREQFNSEDLPSTVTATPGAGGVFSGAGGNLGTVSSFGSYVVSTPGIGSAKMPTGVFVSASTPGAGGDGGSQGGVGFRGGASALAAGGVVGSTTGGNGAAAGSDPDYISGGGGGAGGSGSFGTGGNGGFPGGAGAGGSATVGNRGNGGTGAAGAIYVTVKARPA
jgi:hypothetical protein